MSVQPAETHTEPLDKDVILDCARAVGKMAVRSNLKSLAYALAFACVYHEEQYEAHMVIHRAERERIQPETS